MLAQIGWLAAGFIAGCYAEAKLKNYFYENFEDEMVQLEKAKAKVKFAKEELGEAMKAKWEGKLADRSFNIDEALRNIGEQSRDRSLGAILETIQGALRGIDWDELRKKAAEIQKEFKGESQCCRPDDKDCCGSK